MLVYFPLRGLLTSRIVRAQFWFVLFNIYKRKARSGPAVHDFDSLKCSFLIELLEAALSCPSAAAAAAAKSLQSCLTLCDPIDSSPPGSPVHRILQARIPEWIAIPFSRYLPNPVIKPRSPTLQAVSLPSEPPGKPKKTGVGSLSLL